MTRVLLVSSNQERHPYPVPPVGLCLLAERLGQEYEVRLFDGMFTGPEELRQVIDGFSPDFVGLGVRNVDDTVMERPRFYLDEILEGFVRPIRATTRAPLILGGSGFSIFPDEILSFLGADYGLVGEAEQTLPALLDGLVRGGDLPDHHRLVRPSTGRTAPRPLGGGALEQIGPSRIERWLDFSTYRPQSVYPLQTKRGCGHGCVYCTYPSIEGRRYRLRSPGAIVDELERAHARLGDEVTFEFVDSIFNDPVGHAVALCEELIRRDLGLRLRTMGLNPRFVTEELLRSMKRAGFSQMDCTPDSASPAVLAKLGKGFGLEELERAARLIRQAGIPTMWFMLFGAPGETEETFRETLDFIDRFVDQDDMVAMWAGLRVYPGTALHGEALRAGVVGEAEDLLRPTYYVSPELGRERCIELIGQACRSRPNCVPAWESAPDKQLLTKALELRGRAPGAEPLFRTLIRLRRQRMGATAQP